MQCKSRIALKIVSRENQSTTRFSTHTSSFAQKLYQMTLVLARVRTHNLGFVPLNMSILGHLRCPKIRAQEIVQSIVCDLYQPDILCFQEGIATMTSDKE
ncbi:hypothetical protein ACTFIW_010320 [Dictyostelium discoideum]